MQVDEQLLLKEAFSQHDPGLEGFIDSADLVYVMRRLGANPKENEVKEITAQIEKVETLKGIQTNKIFFEDFRKYVADNPIQFLSDEELTEHFRHLYWKVRNPTTHAVHINLNLDEFFYQLKTIGVKFSEKDAEFLRKYIVGTCEVNGQLDVGRLIGRTRL